MVSGPVEPVEITLLADGRPRLIYIGTDLQVVNLDDGELPAHPREAAYCEALRKLAKPKSRTSGTLL